MRPLLLLVLLLFPIFAGCTSGATQWAGIAHAYQYRTSSLVDIQLHAARPGVPATLDTAHAGMSAVERVEDAVASVTLRNGTTRTFTLTDWIRDTENETMSTRMPVTGFDAFHFNATFILKNGTKIRTNQDAEWTDVFSRAFHGIMSVSDRQVNTSLAFTIYEVYDGMTGFEYVGVSGDNSMAPANVTRLDAWHMRVTGTNGTVIEETAPATLNGATITSVIPYRDVAKVEAQYTVQLRDGTRLTEKDVDGDAHPLSFVLSQERTQRN